MTQWKNNREKRIPFMAKGNGRIRDLDQKVDELAEKISAQMPILALKELPQDIDENTIYLVYEDDEDE